MNIINWDSENFYYVTFGIYFLVCPSICLSQTVSLPVTFNMHKTYCSYFVCIFFGSGTSKWHHDWQPDEVDHHPLIPNCRVGDCDTQNSNLMHLLYEYFKWNFGNIKQLPNQAILNKKPIHSCRWEMFACRLKLLLENSI